MFQCLSRRSRRRAGTPKVSRLRRPLRLEPLEQRLAPAAAHVAVIGDYGTAGTPERDVAALVKSWNPDVIITTGDNNYETGAASTIDATSASITTTTSATTSAVTAPAPPPTASSPPWATTTGRRAAARPRYPRPT